LVLVLDVSVVLFFVILDEVDFLALAVYEFVVHGGFVVTELVHAVEAVVAVRGYYGFVYDLGLHVTGTVAELLTLLDELQHAVSPGHPQYVLDVQVWP
jgi:hypothetical protein